MNVATNLHRVACAFTQTKYISLMGAGLVHITESGHWELGNMIAQIFRTIHKHDSAEVIVVE